MKIAALVDPMGTSRQSPDEEYAEILELFAEILGIDSQKIDFRKDVYPWELSNGSYDVYVMDYGGMMPGCESTIASLFREMIRQIQEHPNTLFFIWSAFTAAYWYKLMIEEEFPEFVAQNVIMRGVDDDAAKISVWFKGPPDQAETGYSAPFDTEDLQ